ncbi:hypothetical protein [Streptomyces sp. NPDC052042]|uniref:hypothetical protein n=1 Tax=Streptomyces sp. NPDC052042 TaxID=3365683 RepID=UPI0037D42B94
MGASRPGDYYGRQDNVGLFAIVAVAFLSGGLATYTLRRLFDSLHRCEKAPHH